jgi:mannose-6-phosphate isomerase-like protein (cupin superfamily)
MKVRRVVTGHDETGNAVFVADEEVDPVTSTLLPGYAFHQLWTSDVAPTFPDGGVQPQLTSYFPPVGGIRCALYTLPGADSTVVTRNGDARAALRKLENDLPGLLDFNEPGGTGMHKTPTIDFELVLAGEIILELDDGATVTLRPGDVVVQNGTRHRWVNAGDVPAMFVVFLSGAHHDDIEKI